MKSKTLGVDELKGVIPRVATLLNNNGNLDIEKTQILMRYLRDNGAKTLVFGGHGRLHSADERRYNVDVIRRLESDANYELPFIVGVSKNSLDDSLRFAEEMEDFSGARTFLYSPIARTSEEAISAYREFVGSVRGNVIIDNSGLLGSGGLGIEDTYGLVSSGENGFVGVSFGESSTAKEVGQFIDRRDIIIRKPLAILAGNEASFLEMVAEGAQGVISYVSNFVAGPVNRMVSVQSKRDKILFADRCAVDSFVHMLYREAGSVAGKTAHLFGTHCYGEPSLRGVLDDIKDVHAIPVKELAKDYLGAWRNAVSFCESLRQVEGANPAIYHPKNKL